MSDAERAEKRNIFGGEAGSVETIDQIYPSVGGKAGNATDAAMIVIERVQGANKLDLVIGLAPELDG